ncbi:hypothetical protein, partial [Kitasatospora sp. NPDC001683]
VLAAVDRINRAGVSGRTYHAEFLALGCGIRAWVPTGELVAGRGDSCWSASSAVAAWMKASMSRPSASSSGLPPPQATGR